MSHLMRSAMLALTGVLPAVAAHAQSFNNDRGIGAKGYDVVAYFTAGEAAKGSPQFTYEHDGVTWRFASAENRDMFKADPAKYAPQYGGYCAYGVAVGGLYDVQPDKAWSVVDGKLYLNKDAGVKQTWLKDVPGNISSADANWPKIRK
jgi:YHS domain-containing protein